MTKPAISLSVTGLHLSINFPLSCHDGWVPNLLFASTIHQFYLRHLTALFSTVYNQLIIHASPTLSHSSMPRSHIHILTCMCLPLSHPGAPHTLTFTFLPLSHSGAIHNLTCTCLPLSHSDAPHTLTCTCLPLSYSGAPYTLISTCLPLSHARVSRSHIQVPLTTSHARVSRCHIQMPHTLTCTCLPL